MDSIGDLEKRVRELSTALSLHTEDEAVRDTQISVRMEDLFVKVEELTKAVRTLLDLWEQARGMVTLVKWCAAIGGSLASVYLFVKGK